MKTKIKKNLKLALCMTMLLGLCLTAGIAPAQGAAITVKVDGNPVIFPDQAPYLDAQDRTLVPIRFPMQAMGVTVTWNDQTQQATLTRGETTAVFSVGSNHYTVNGTDTIMDTVPVLKNDRTVFPIRFAAEAFGASVVWDDASNTVNISTGGSAPAAEHVVVLIIGGFDRWGTLKRTASDNNAYYFVCTNYPEANTYNCYDLKGNFKPFDSTSHAYIELVLLKDDARPWSVNGQKPYPNFTPVKGMTMEFDIYAENPDGSMGVKVDHVSVTLGEDHLN